MIHDRMSDATYSTQTVCIFDASLFRVVSHVFPNTAVSLFRVVSHVFTDTANALSPISRTIQAI